MASASPTGIQRSASAPGAQPAQTPGSTSATVHSLAQTDLIAQHWLETQCSIMAGVSSAIVLRHGPAAGSPESDQAVARWPTDSTETGRGLIVTAKEALTSLGFVIQTPDVDGDAPVPHCLVATPLLTRDTEIVVAAFSLPAAVSRQQQALMQLLQWGSTWYQLLRREPNTVVAKDRLVDVVEMLAGSLEHANFAAAAATAVTELAARLACSRASLGLVQGQHVQVHAISASASVDTRSNLVRDIGSAMDEAVDQSATIAFPPLPGSLPHVSFAQEVLVRRNDGGSVCSTPLYDGDRIVGALTLERDGGRHFDAAAVETCEVFGALLGPIMALKHERERFVGLKVWDVLRGFLARLFGRKHFALKAYAIGLVVLVAVLSVATGDYRVTAQATLEGSVRRVITAPRDGFMASALQRAGDIVDAGQVLATLDDRELVLERVKLESQREQFNKEYRAALTEHDRSSAAIISARRAQTVAQLALIDEQLNRSTLTAPFAGMVVSGDMSQSLGSPVEHGQVLFEVAPLDAYRVILQVDERDIGAVTDAQRGTLTLTGLPGDALPFTVTRIVPISTARDGRNFFEVEATLDDSPSLVRPGMAGVGKIDIDQRKLIWVWTHALIDWLRLTFWTWTA